MTKEQKRAIALANARKRQADALGGGVDTQNQYDLSLIHI